MKPSKPPKGDKAKLPTHCIACGLVAPNVLHFEWDLIYRNEEMLLTCSKDCRKRFGIAERKYWPKPRGLEGLWD